MSEQAERLHALDNLRALMMWLGIVLHVAAIYPVGESPLPWRDERRTVVADFLLPFIHAFRMPVFFVLAGFFVAMLLRSRGPAGLAKHRALRLGLPFAVFWLPIFTATVVFALLFLHRVARGTWGFDPALVPRRPETAEGPNTIHLWFLWMLLWMSLATALLARVVPARWWDRPAAMLRGAAKAWWGPLVLAAPLVATDAGYRLGVMFPSGSFVPPVAEWVHNGLFFVMGLALHGARDELLAVFVARRRVYAAVGLATFVAAGALVERQMAAPFAFAYDLTGWLWTFALLGAALSWMPAPSRVLGYLADSSYWVYLVHFPLTIAFGALLYVTDLPALAKMALNIAATTLVCLATYHLLVRFTWVGVLLNGKRHARMPLPPVRLTPA